MKLSGVFVRLHYPEYVFFGVEAICIPTNAAYGAFFHGYFAAMLLYLTQIFIDVRDVYCANISAYRGVRSGFSSLPPHQASVDSQLTLLIGRYVPVIHRTFPSLYFPAKYSFIELFSPCNIPCIYLKMNYSWRDSYLLP